MRSWISDYPIDSRRRRGRRGTQIYSGHWTSLSSNKVTVRRAETNLTRTEYTKRSTHTRTATRGFYKSPAVSKDIYKTCFERPLKHGSRSGNHNHSHPLRNGLP